MTEKKLYLSDEPIHSSDDDSFRHNIFTDILFKIIEDVEPPWNIGLFGKWGVGKTSIVKLLISKVDAKPNKQKIAYFEFDAWKYSDDSLREQILLELNHEFDIYDDEKIRDKLFCIVEEDVPLPKKGDWRNQFTRLIREAKSFLISFFVILLLSGGLVYYFKNPQILPFLLSTLLIPLFLMLINKIDKVNLAQGRRHNLPIRESPGQFEEIFSDMIGKIDEEKVLIIIDNLDRCPSKIVIQILGTIKTFMNIEKCIYIIPCDDEAIRKHLKRVKGEGYLDTDAQEFLRKFFQTILKIPQFSEGDVERYCKILNSKIRFPFKENVTDVFKSAYNKNPRRIKQAFNKLTTLNLLAQEKEDKDIIKKGTITNHLEFLAKISIIEEEWPDFYQELIYNENLLEEAEDSLRNSIEEIQPVLKELLEKNRGLEEFLNLNRIIQVDDIGPFLRLSQEPYEIASPELTKIRNCIPTRDAKRIQEIFENATDEDEKIGYITCILDILKKTRRDKRYQVQFNCLYILAEIYDQIPDQIKTSVNSLFSTNIDTPVVRGNIKDFNPSSLFKVLQNLPRRNFVLSKYIEWVLRDADTNHEILDQFIKYHEIVPPEAKSNLSHMLLERLVNDQTSEIAIETIEIVASSDAKSSLLNQKVVQSLIERIGIEEEPEEETKYNQGGLELYLKVKDIADNKNKERFIRKQFSLVDPEASPNLDVIEILDNLENSDIPDSFLDEFYREVITHANRYNLVDRYPHYGLIIRHFNRFSDENKNNFMEDCLRPLFSEGNSDAIVKVLDVAAKNKVRVLEHGDFLTILLDRIKGELQEVQVFGSIILSASKNSLVKIKDFMINSIKEEERSFKEFIASTYLEYYENFEDNQIDEISNALLDIAQNVEKESKSFWVERATPVNSFIKCKNNTQKRIIEHIIGLLTHDEMNFWTNGKNIYDKIAERIPQNLKSDIASQTVLRLQRVGDEDLPNILLDVMSGLEGETKKQDWEKYLDILSRMMSEAQPNDKRISGFQYLEKVNKLYGRQELIEGQILQAAKSGGDVSESVQEVIKSFKEKKIGSKKFLEEANNLL